MWAEHVVSNTALRRAGDGIAFDIRLNWSRSIPMSCVQELVVAIDGERIDGLTLAQGGEDLPLRAWADRDDIWWPVLAPATVTAAHRMASGAHRLDIELRVRVPAFPPGPDGVWPTRFTRATSIEELA